MYPTSPPGTGPRPGRAPILIGSIVAALCVGGGVASASDQTTTIEETTATEEPGLTAPATAEEAATEDAHETATGQGTGAGEAVGDESSPATELARGTGGTGSGDGGGGELRLKLEAASPNRIFFSGTRRARFKFEIGGTKRRDLKLEVVRRGGKVFKVERRDGVPPDTVRKMHWNGKRKGGGAVPKGKYFFRVSEQGGGTADRDGAKGDRVFAAYPNKFPVRGRHSYGDGYGAGRGHRGVDVFARCGTPLVAARAGRVTAKSYQGGGAGHYVVIDGKAQRRDYVYMHLKRRASVREGERVRTGERIGKVGASGNASGCHLHLEVWKGQWYGGGHPIRRIKPLAKKWDRWS